MILLVVCALMLAGILAFLRLKKLSDRIDDLERKLNAIETPVIADGAAVDRLARRPAGPAVAEPTPASAAPGISGDSGRYGGPDVAGTDVAGVDTGASADAPDRVLADPGSSPHFLSGSAPEITVADLPSPVGVHARRAALPAEPPPSSLALSADAAFASLRDSLAGNPLSQLIRANPFVILGVLMVLVGLGFLFSLLAMSNLLSPMVRVCAVAVAGVLLFFLGLHQERQKTDSGFGPVLQGGALAVEYLCAYWAFAGYGLISAITAFAWMGGLSALAMAWSVARRRALFAFIGTLGSVVTPLLTASGSTASLALFFDPSGLAMPVYCAWITLLALGAALYLRLPLLACVALAGVVALLLTSNAAPALPSSRSSGSAGWAPIWLPVLSLLMLVGYLALAWRWIRVGAGGHDTDGVKDTVGSDGIESGNDGADRRDGNDQGRGVGRAGIVFLLLAAPLMFMLVMVGQIDGRNLLTTLALNDGAVEIAPHVTIGEPGAAGLAGLSPPVLSAGGFGKYAGGAIGLAVALLYLALRQKAVSSWRLPLCQVAACLGAVTLVMVTDGAGPLLFLVTLTVIAVVVAETASTTWARWLAMTCWCSILVIELSGALGNRHGVNDVSAAILVLTALLGLGASAIAAGKVHRLLYALPAAPLLQQAWLHHVPPSPLSGLVFFLGWAGLAMWIAQRREWPALRLSAIWLLPAGFVFLFSEPYPLELTAMLLREAALVAWMATALVLVFRIHAGSPARHATRPSLLSAPATRLPAWFGLALLACPVVASMEVDLYQASHNLSFESAASLVLLIWSGWTLAASTCQARLNVNLHALSAGTIAATLLVVLGVVGDPGWRMENALWIAATLLVLAPRTIDRQTGDNAAHGAPWPSGAPGSGAGFVSPSMLARCHRVAAGLAAFVVVGGILRTAARLLGAPDALAGLLWEESMQPWVSLVWAAAAITVVAIGSATASRRMWRNGCLAIVLLAAKMLLVDLAALSLIARVAVFLLTGTGLILLGRFSPAPASAPGAAPGPAPSTPAADPAAG